MVELVIIGVTIGLFCALVLYRAAEREHRRAWVWAIVGLLTSVVGLLVFRLTVGPIVKW